MSAGAVEDHFKDNMAFLRQTPLDLLSPRRGCYLFDGRQILCARRLLPPIGKRRAPRAKRRARPHDEQLRRDGLFGVTALRTLFRRYGGDGCRPSQAREIPEASLGNKTWLCIRD